MAKRKHMRTRDKRDQERPLKRERQNKCVIARNREEEREKREQRNSDEDRENIFLVK